MKNIMNKLKFIIKIEVNMPDLIDFSLQNPKV